MRHKSQRSKDRVCEKPDSTAEFVEPFERTLLQLEQLIQHRVTEDNASDPKIRQYALEGSSV